MNALWHDLRYGARMMRQRPGFTFIAVLVLALGVGANTAIFSVVNAVLLRPLPVKDAERVVVPVSTNPERGFDSASVSYGDFLDWQREEVFERVAVYQFRDYDLTQSGEPERVRGLAASGDFFSILGTQPMLGRVLAPDDYAAGGADVAVISEGLWRRRFGSDRALLDRTITLSGRQYAVLGVVPDIKFTPEPIDVWTPLRFTSGGPSEDMLRRDNF
ncbi:MAG TPA: ABC transporter permease, partial [Pyrinomonadaceae bacterium]|nr:ABC transporter permease [Pyrinomonadaceae bacterium]